MTAMDVPAPSAGIASTGPSVDAGSSSAAGRGKLPAAGIVTEEEDVRAAEPEPLGTSRRGTGRTGAGTPPERQDGADGTGETPRPTGNSDGGDRGNPGVAAWKAALTAHHAEKARGRKWAKTQRPKPGMIRRPPPGGAA